MPSIIDVSKELLRRTRVPLQPEQSLPNLPATVELESRVRLLEDNERRQAELLTRVAEQLAQLTVAVTALHRQVRWLLIALIATSVVAVAALVLAVTHPAFLTLR